MANYSRKVKIPGKTRAQLFTILSADIERLMSKVSLGQHEVKPEPEQSQLKIKGSGFTAVLSCTDGEMAIEAQLGLLVLPFKSKLDEAVVRWVNKTFNLQLS